MDLDASASHWIFVFLFFAHLNFGQMAGKVAWHEGRRIFPGLPTRLVGVETIGFGEKIVFLIIIDTLEIG